MLASRARVLEHASGRDFAHTNGTLVIRPKMTAKILTNGEDVYNEEELAVGDIKTEVGKDIPGEIRSSRMKNMSRPPPIDIGIARNAAAYLNQYVSQEDDEETEEDWSSVSSEEKTSTSEATLDGTASPNCVVASPDSIASSAVTSPASVASSDTTDGGILRRKSSLKGNSKTPETPGGKSVRFADALGLDLETVRDILESESPPDYPSMAAAACAAAAGCEGLGGTVNFTLQPRYLSMSFVQPGGQPDFLTRVNQRGVCLENAVISDFTVLGTIKCQNLSYHKRVKVRYSSDGWKTFGDIPASYVQNSCDGPTDRFSFGLSAPRDMAVGDRVEFCICYTAGNRDYWDNNFGKNYALVCHAQGEVIDAENSLLWTHFLGERTTTTILNKINS